MTIALSPKSPSFPAVRGRFEEQVGLAKYSWLRVGGAADYLFRPQDEQDLITFLQHKPAAMPITTIGAASNLLIRDGGVRGVVIRLGSGFNHMRYEPDEGRVYAGAGAMDIQLARFAANQGLSGFEFLSGIPGTLGGAVAMNAGAYGREVADCLEAIEGVLPDGTPCRLNADQLNFSYRHAELPQGLIVTNLIFSATEHDTQEVILKRMQDIAEQREQTQPTRLRTGGSTFKNPPNAKAWQLIDQAGLRGAEAGDACISELHCNFLINRGNAKADQLERLGEQAVKAVKAQTGITLEWELIRIGSKSIS